MKHPHADLIKQMVDDDTLRATYTGCACPCDLNTVYAYPKYDWRLVPPKPKTITIMANGKTYELPEPMRVAPVRGTEFFFQGAKAVGSYSWRKDECDMDWLAWGVCHATREAAQAWVDAMAEIRGAK